MSYRGGCYASQMSRITNSDAKQQRDSRSSIENFVFCNCSAHRGHERLRKTCKHKGTRAITSEQSKWQR